MLRIAITGPESTGKTTLSDALAVHFNGILVPEFAREYLELKGPAYCYSDVVKIARGQLRSERKLASLSSNILISDTELLVIKIWMEYKFKKTPTWLEPEINANRYDLYLLCNVDFPWQEDPLREHPHLRTFFFDKFLNELTLRNFPYVIISGNRDERFRTAVQAIEKLRINN